MVCEVDLDRPVLSKYYCINVFSATYPKEASRSHPRVHEARPAAVMVGCAR